MDKKIYYSIMTILFITLITTFYYSYLLFYPFKTLEIKSIVAVTKEIKPGDVFLYSVNYCKYTKAPAVVYRTFHKTDESHIETFPAVSTISVMGCATTEVPLPVSLTTPSGDYYLLVDAVFDLNPLRQEHVIFKSNIFKVK